MTPRYQDPRPRVSKPVHRTGRLTDIDAADAANLLRISFWFAPACILILSFFWYFLWNKGVISGAQFGILLVVDFPLAGVGVLLINSLVSRSATALVDVIYSKGDIPAPPSYPRQELLIARGEYREAAEFYRDHLVVEPNDNEARLRLAFLLETRLSDDAGAEAVYKEVRSHQPSPREAASAANGLIDLYRRTGRVDRLRVELARFAERYKGTRAGDGAAKELAEFRRDSGASGEPAASPPHRRARPRESRPEGRQDQ
jgi:hypothetical protein